jgi:uncharacterized protein (TIGR01777 family)
VKRVVLTGATGLLGRHLAAALVARGDDVVPLSRGTRTVAGVTTTPWDPTAGPIPAHAADGADVIVNLAGEPIGAGRWTTSRREQILKSREATTRCCVEALRSDGSQVLVSASAIGYYGSTDTPVDESAAPGEDYLAQVCVRWEDAARRGEDKARVVRVRTGIVLARDGGAYPRLALVTRLGVAGPLGSGRQWMSWIHVDDEVAVLLACIDDAGLHGPVNAVAPSPIRQRAFAQVLADLLHRPSFLRAPAPVLRLVLGEMADLLLVGQRVVPAVLAARNTAWTYPTLSSALNDLALTPAPPGRLR